MSMVINLANNIKLKESGSVNNIEDMRQYFPKMLWVLRDFTLKLEDMQGNDISMNQYLENSLKEVKGLSENIKQKNYIRKILREFFPNRDC